MDFTLTEDQQALKDLAARILDDATRDEPWRTKGEAFDAALWQTLAEAGVLGVPVSEDAGGLGMGMYEAGLILEEQGRTLASVPLAPAFAAGMTLDRFGNDATKSAWLSRLVDGSAQLAVALEEMGNPALFRPQATARMVGNRWRLDGVKEAVPYGEGADAFLVSAATDAGMALFLVDAGTEGVTVRAQQSSTGKPWAQVTLDAAPVAPEAMVGAADGKALRALVARLQVAAAFRQVGIAAEGLRRTAEYVSGRVQFGRPIGTFQAVQQRMADGFIDLEAMRSLAMLAAAGIDRGQPVLADVAAAKYWAAEGGHRIAHTGQHLHGGMGSDITYPIHRYFLAAVETGEQWSGARPMLAAIGAEIAAHKTEPFT